MKTGLRTLYFIKSHVPTEKERADAENYGNNVSFRNSMFVEGDTIEQDVYVAGSIPDAYAEHPKAKKLKEAKEAVGGDKPKAGGKVADTAAGGDKGEWK